MNLAERASRLKIRIFCVRQANNREYYRSEGREVLHESCLGCCAASSLKDEVFLLIAPLSLVSPPDRT